MGVMTANANDSYPFPIRFLSKMRVFIFLCRHCILGQTGSLFVYRSVDYKKPYLDLMKTAAQNPEILGFEWDAVTCGGGSGFH